MPTQQVNHTSDVKPRQQRTAHEVESPELVWGYQQCGHSCVMRVRPATGVRSMLKCLFSKLARERQNMSWTLFFPIKMANY